MRPVNLIPVEQRHGERAPMRSGPVAYLIVGALLAALAGVTVLVLTSNQISDSKAEVARLSAESASTKARADALAGYTQFQGVRDQRVASVTSLADSRFDWERVMRELSLVLPDDVWLINLTGTASPAVQPTGGAGISLRASIPGPALELVGCANNQEAVASFVSTLKDIDGVTRVGMQSSLLSDSSSAGSIPTQTDSAAGSVGDTSECRTRDFITKFEIVAAFDAAPAPSTAAATSPDSTSAPTTSTDTTSTTDATATPTGG